MFLSLLFGDLWTAWQLGNLFCINLNGNLSGTWA
jgi:hypothetical protein